MFKRKNKRGRLAATKEMLWPSMGWGRYLKFLMAKLKRISISSTTESVASGLSFGWFISFNPMLGTHTFWMLGLAWVFNANFLAMMIASLVGNIWTFPFLLWTSLQVGEFIAMTLFGDTSLSFLQNIAWLQEMSWFREAGNNFILMLIGWPFIGGLLYAITYFPHYYLVKNVKEAYHKRKKEKHEARNQ
jgi:hypothetical protein